MDKLTVNEVISMLRALPERDRNKPFSVVGISLEDGVFEESHIEFFTNESNNLLEPRLQQGLCPEAHYRNPDGGWIELVGQLDCTIWEDDEIRGVSRMPHFDVEVVNNRMRRK